MPGQGVLAEIRIEMMFSGLFRCMLASFVVVPFAADAQNYPDRSVRVIVTFAPGGAPDVIARAVAAQVEAQLKQTLVIDNRAGATPAPKGRETRHGIGDRGRQIRNSQRGADA
jgi:hypothetical protein